MTSRITILHTPGCPHAELARQRIEEAFSRIRGTPPAVDVVEVADPDEAVRLGFQGSPTLLFDGADRFAPQVDAPAFACRIYTTDGSHDGAPSVEQILAVLGTADNP